MIDHDVFTKQLASAQHDSGGALTREDVLELLIEHIATSEHRMALPAYWSKDAVAAKLRDVFADDPLIATMLDAFERTLAENSDQQEPRQRASS